MLRRRRLIMTSAAAMAMPAICGAAAVSTLRFVPVTDLTVLDPHWTPASVTRDHGYLVFDTLFGLDRTYRPSPQMVGGSQVEDDGRRWALGLRSGLWFHNGEPVLARDCVASIRRWGQRDPLGQTLMAVTDELSASDDRTLVFRLKKPFPLLPAALGKMASPMPAIMPEYLAKTDPFTQVKEMVGSGPFRFKADERMAGVRTVYERFDRYQPRPDGVADATAGPKIANFDRIEWTVLPDPAIATAALLKGEQDWLSAITLDLLPLIKANQTIVAEALDPCGRMVTMRPNHLNPPFNNPRIRRALLRAVNQSDFVVAIAGNDPSMWQVGVGIFAPSSPMANDAGMGILTGTPDIAAARTEIVAAGYAGERVVVVAPSDIEDFRRAAEVGADWLRQLGMNVDYQLSDSGTFTQRREKKEPIDHGGWSCYFVTIPGMDMMDPAGTNFLRGNARYMGWPDCPQIEALRNAWLDATDPEQRKQIARQIQRQAFVDVPYIPLGIYKPLSAFRADLQSIPRGFPIFWGVNRRT